MRLQRPQGVRQAQGTRWACSAPPRHCPAAARATGGRAGACRAPHARDTAAAAHRPTSSSADPAPAPGAAADPAWKWEASDDAVAAYGALLAILGVGAIPALHTNPYAGGRAK